MTISSITPQLSACSNLLHFQHQHPFLFCSNISAFVIEPHPGALMKDSSAHLCLCVLHLKMASHMAWKMLGDGKDILWSSWVWDTLKPLSYMTKINKNNTKVEIEKTYKKLEDDKSGQDGNVYWVAAKEWKPFQRPEKMSLIRWKV